MTWLLTALGTVLIAVALRDIFHTLWHPQGAGTLSRNVFHGIWRLTGVYNRRGRTTELAGPLGFLGTAVVWTLLVVAGWTLVYLPRMPEGFYFSSSLEPGSSSDLLASVYLSLVAVTTLGLGDITPADPALRLVVPLQGLVGFVLLTAGISWVLQVYPTLGRRRTLAQWFGAMAATDAAEVVRSGAPCVATRLLETGSAGLSSAETDLIQYPESYYFRENRPDLSLPASVVAAVDLAEAGAGSGSPEVRHAAVVLQRAVDSLAHTLDTTYLRTGGGPREVFAAWAADHQQEQRVPSAD